MSPEADSLGYLSGRYVEALAEFGRPRPLSRSGGWVVERTIAGTGLRDAMGPYPLLACQEWEALGDDLEEIGSDLVSVVAVADPLGAFREENLRRAFPDLMRPFKQHFIVELDSAPASFVANHHQRNARKALGKVDVALVEPAEAAEEWIALYSNLIDRHRIRGIAAFTPLSLRQQLSVPGASLFAARHEGRLVGLTIWYGQQGNAYYHLGAYSDLGYELRASFALFWRAFEHFTATGVRLLDLGAGAGLDTDGEDGLTRFKRGWSTTTRPAFLCGRILDREAYQALSAAKASAGTGADMGFFPAYRRGDFG
jgi:hypothetical protein